MCIKFYKQSYQSYLVLCLIIYILICEQTSCSAYLGQKNHAGLEATGLRHVEVASGPIPGTGSGEQHMQAGKSCMCVSAYVCGCTYSPSHHGTWEGEASCPCSAHLVPARREPAQGPAWASSLARPAWPVPASVGEVPCVPPGCHPAAPS